MNRTENQEQSRAKKRGRGKRGNEIVARERTGDGRKRKEGEGGKEKRERGDDLRGKTKGEKVELGIERGSKSESANVKQALLECCV